MKNGQIWFDVDNNQIQAHGGCIVKFGNTFYWYGENKGCDNIPGTRRVENIGISCYTSTDLVNWKYQGLVLKSEHIDTSSKIYYKNIMERPKVIFNEETNQYVMLVHIDSPDYLWQQVGVAVSNSPIGPFEFVKAVRPNGRCSMDFTVFVDKNKTAHLIHTTEGDYSLCVSRLTKDYMNFDGYSSEIFVNQLREAPALFYKSGAYYMITSGVTGWDANSALYAKSPNLYSGWRFIDNPCVGENYRKTFFGQSSYIFENEGKFYLMLDHWKPYELKNSGYSILPITFNEDGLTVVWSNDWNGIEK